MTAYLGELRIMAFGTVPAGWMSCDGQILDIATWPQLFAVLTARYGGDGVTTFALPDLRGRVPIGAASEFPWGLPVGAASHVLTIAETPRHAHDLSANDSRDAELNTGAPAASSVLGKTVGSPATGAAFTYDLYSPATAQPGTMHSASIALAGSSQAHENRQPFTVLSICIAVTDMTASAA